MEHDAHHEVREHEQRRDADRDVEQQAEEQTRVENHEHEPREHVGRALERREVRDVGDDEADQRDADRRDLRVVAPRRGQRDRDGDHRDERAQHAEPQRVELGTGRGAEHEIDARDREHEYQGDQPRESRARQVLLHVEVAEILLEQTRETQLREAALQLIGDTASRGSSVSSLGNSISRKSACQVLPSPGRMPARTREFPNAIHNREAKPRTRAELRRRVRSAIQRQQRLFLRQLSGIATCVEVRERGAQRAPLPLTGRRTVDVRLEIENLLRGARR